MYAEDEARLLRLAASSDDELDALVERRVSGVPLEHVLGWAEFCGFRVGVQPGVFVPRRRTELLVREAAALVRPGAVVVDLCCGSGAVAAALIGSVGGISLHAVDVDPAAAQCAIRNLAPAGGAVYVGDLYAPLPAELRGRVDVVVANVPYVPTGELALMPPEARDHEPRVALDGGPDGLGVLRRVAAGARQWLAPGGSLLVETSAEQAPRAVEIFGVEGLAARVATSAELEATVVVGTATTA